MNTYLTIGMVTNEALRVLVNNTVFTAHVNREYDDKFAVAGAKIGNVLNIRRPPRYLTAIGQALQIEDATETSVPLVLNTQRHLGLAFTSADLVLSIDEFSKRFIRPGIATLSNFIDFDGLQQFFNIFNEVGIPGTIPNTALLYLQGNQRLNEMACPVDDHHLCISPGMNAVIVDALKGLFHDSTMIEEQYMKGMIGRGLGYDGIYMDQNVPTFQVGPQGGVPVVNGANQTGNLIITNGWTAAAAVRLNRGDVIQFAGCFAVNPQNRQSTGTLANWIVTATVSSDGAGNLTIPIQGPLGNGIIVAGPFQNASASPTNGGSVTVNGAANTNSPRGIGFHPDAFTLGMADLLLPGGVDMAERASSKELKASLRIIRAYDINQDRFPFRADVLYGWATLYPELAFRLAS
jgi:P22 coat protein - gene protein 5